MEREGESKCIKIREALFGSYDVMLTSLSCRRIMIPNSRFLILLLYFHLSYGRVQ